MRHRDFSRNGVLSLELLVTLLLFMVGDGRRRGYRHMLDAFWDEALVADIPLPTESPVSAPAFCQARAKLSSSFLRKLLHEVGARFDSKFQREARWNGRRVLAVDGTGFNLQRSDDLFRSFRCQTGAYCPQAEISTVINIMSKVPIDVAVAPCQTSERKLLLEEHLPHLRPGDVMVFDRGYPGFKLFQELLTAGIDFVARVSTVSTFPAVEEFLQTGGQDRIILIEPTDSAARSALPLRLRAVRSQRPDGDDVVLITNLHKREGYSRAKLEELYHLRWQAEEYYKTFKSSYMGQQQLHSKTPSGVRQEIYAIALFHALTQYFLAAAAELADAPYSHLSTKSGCLGLSDYIVRLFIDPSQANRWLLHLLERIARTRDKQRPGRSHPRRSFRPRTRWGPRGRTRA